SASFTFHVSLFTLISLPLTSTLFPYTTLFRSVLIMERPVNRYTVSNFSKVDTTKYMNGDIFYTDKEVGVLINSKIKKFPASTPNLKEYVKQSDIENFITEEDVQTLIDE